MVGGVWLEAFEFYSDSLSAVGGAEADRDGGPAGSVVGASSVLECVRG